VTSAVNGKQTLWLALVLALAYLPNLGQLSGQTRPEEQFNMAVSAEMHRGGAWATPTLDGAPWFYKPPLLYWLERAAYVIAGPSAFTARLPAVLAALAIALLTGAFARRLGADRSLATLLCGGSLGLFLNGRMAITDALLALGLALAFWCLWEAHQREDGRWLVAMGAAVGLGVMAKGPVAGVIFLGGALPFALLRQEPRFNLFRPKFLALALAAALLVAVPWYALMLARHREVFFDFFFVKMNVDRFRTPWELASLAALWGGFFVMLVPWLPLALAATVDALAAARRREPRYLLLLCWAVAVLLTFSIPAQKFHHYGLPAVPAMALLVALLWAERGASRALRWGVIATAALHALTAVAALVAARVLPPVLSLLVAAAAALAAVAYFKRRAAAAAALGLTTVALLLGWLTPAVGAPPWPEGLVVPAERPLWVYQVASRGSLTMATGRPVGFLGTPEELSAQLDAGDLVWMREYAFPGPPYEIVAEQPAIKTAVSVDEVLQAFREGSLKPLATRALVVGKKN
jgi:4-amino-4-deoxy-L-arabinose transferase-like glycosyltransferase